MGTFYRPPNSSNYYDKDFIIKLDNTLDTATAKGREVLITGDLNEDLLCKRDTIPECKQLRTLLKGWQFKHLIDKPTRIARNSSTLLDIVAANCPQNISHSGVITTSLSDNEMVYCIRKINWQKAPAQTKTFRNYANYDHKAFCDELRDTELAPSGDISSCVNDLWNTFKSAFVSVANRHAPIIQKRVRGLDNCLWLNKDIKHDIRQRNYM